MCVCVVWVFFWCISLVLLSLVWIIILGEWDFGGCYEYIYIYECVHEVLKNKGTQHNSVHNLAKRNFTECLSAPFDSLHTMLIVSLTNVNGLNAKCCIFIFILESILISLFGCFFVKFFFVFNIREVRRDDIYLDVDDKIE